MYLDFYGLNERPFNTTPDPKFLQLTVGHREALAQLLYGVQEQRGFIVLTGEVGTGKTTLLHTLRQRLEGRAAVAFVFNPTLSFEGLLEYVLKDLGIKEAETHAQRLMALNTFLVEQHAAGQGTVLIIDEAQNLSPATLEQIRLLSNFETSSAKLLQIVLAGQPELQARLDLPELRQLEQRIGLRCAIQPLTREETRDYIRGRLRTAGARDPQLFTTEAIERIAASARGIPRLVNLICDHCLVAGYADQKRRVDRRMVEQAVRYLRGGRRTRRLGARGRRVRLPAGGWRLATAVLLVVVIAVLGLATWRSGALAAAAQRMDSHLEGLVDLARNALGR